MARILLDLPPDYLFETEIAVRATDLNYGGHVGNDTILTYMQETRVQFYRALGFENEMKLEGPVGQIITDAAIQYKGELFLGDTIRVNLGIQDFHKYGFDYVYLLLQVATGKEIARGKTGIVFFDYEKRKISLAPEAVVNRIRGGGK